MAQQFSSLFRYINARYPILMLVLAGLFLPFTVSGATIVKGYLAEATLSAPVANAILSANNDGYEYIANGTTLVIHVGQSFASKELIISDRAVSPVDLKFTLSDTPPVWKFYSKGEGYAKKSGAAPLHQLQIVLPDCAFGNICIPSQKFSVILPQVDEKNSGLVHFYVNSQDVTTFFYFNSENKRFQIKEYYETQFFSYFNGKNDLLKWELVDGNAEIRGEVRILLGNKAIKGKILDEVGKIPSFLTDGMITFHFAGSDEIIPHTLQARINNRGEYSIDGLATFEYRLSVETLPYGVLNLQSLSVADNKTTLELVHTVPVFDMLLSSAGEDSYRSGEFVILKPSSWDPRLTGNISEFRQIAGDPVILTVFKDKIAILFPVKRVSHDELIFWGTVGGKRVMLKLPHPVPVESGYEQFSMFDSTGRYAYTRIDGIEDGDVIEFYSDHMPSASLNSFAKASKDTVRVHLYDERGKAANITSFFTWNATLQGITGKSGKHTDLYNALQNTQSTLGVTFCDETYKDICFRIRKSVRPGGSNLTVDVSSVASAGMKGKNVVLRELNESASPVVRIAQIDSKGRAAFSGIPAGTYQILLADTTLKFHGYAYVDVSDAINAERGTVKVDLPVRPLSSKELNTMQQAITGGNLVRLANKPVQLFPNDYVMFDLKKLDAGIDGNISNFRILGKMPGEHIVYPDNNILAITSDAAADSFATMLFTSGDTLYLLPLHYSGNNLPVIEEVGLDYSMCPSERPLCKNAFVTVSGAKWGVYNGRQPLALTFPVPFKKNEIKVVMESIADITYMFAIDPAKRTITLKKEHIPGFLSNLSTNKEPIVIAVRNRTYKLSLLAGYKSIEVSIVDQNGAQTSLFSGLRAHLSCQSPDINYSRIATIKGAGSVLFDDLPDCDYSLTLIDKKRLFYGYLDNLPLTAGQNRIRTIFPISCIGSNDQFVKNCSPFLPLIQDNRLIAPDFGVLFADDRYLPLAKTISVLPETSLLQYKILGRGVLMFAPRNADPAPVKNTLTLSSDNRSSGISLTYDDISNHLIKTIAKPPQASARVLTVEGVTPSFVFSGNNPLVFKFDTKIKYISDEVSIFIEGGREQANLTDMFTWESMKNTLTLKPEEHDNFLSKLLGGQKQFTINLAPEDPARHYSLFVVIGAGAADIIAEINSGKSVPSIKNGKALLIGRKSKNGNEFRQLADIRNTAEVRFRNVPLGIYELVIFDMSTNVFGSRELSVYSEHSDLYINVEVKLITDQ